MLPPAVRDMRVLQARASSVAAATHDLVEVEGIVLEEAIRQR